MKRIVAFFVAVACTFSLLGSSVMAISRSNDVESAKEVAEAF